MNHRVRESRCRAPPRRSEESWKNERATQRRSVDFRFVEGTLAVATRKSKARGKELRPNERTNERTKGRIRPCTRGSVPFSNIAFISYEAAVSSLLVACTLVLARATFNSCTHTVWGTGCRSTRSPSVLRAKAIGSRLPFAVCCKARSACRLLSPRISFLFHASVSRRAATSASTDQPCR